LIAVQTLGAPIAQLEVSNARRGEVDKLEPDADDRDEDIELGEDEHCRSLPFDQHAVTEPNPTRKTLE